MADTTLTVEHPEGLHARPASVFVEKAKDFEAQITLVHKGEEANAKSMLGVLSLGIDQGAEITIRTQGNDAGEALEALAEMIRNNFADALEAEEEE